MSDQIIDSADPHIAVARFEGIRARFIDVAQLNEAVAKLSMAGFDRADLALPDAATLASPETPVEAAPATTEADSRQARTLATSLAAAAGAMLGGGIAVATGGAAVAAAAAAIAVGGGAGLVAGAAATTAKRSEDAEREHKADIGQLVLSVRATTDEKRQLAEQITRAAGALDVGDA